MTTPTTPSFDSFAADVKIWTLRNFGEKQNPFAGMVEEMGELSRCIIKQMQGIRGYDNPQQFSDHYLDAIGDIGVYSANFAFRYELSLVWPERPPVWELSKHNEHIAYALRHLANLGIGTLSYGIDRKQLSTDLYQFLRQVDYLARLENDTLVGATMRTWEQVKNRDWTKNKANGLALADANELQSLPAEEEA